ncbi:IDEAL domain-containing protein [Mesobacillus foraminis]|jgi:uncharacterized protein YpiB (UPF0302 family)|uniref:IDEAL domain-containing protein n=1 Tax=Mesobacillus foraminis TaxID=279826 RepID=A0A4R2BKN0_9BACI|nr:IDEAL domain-containing protein [Mesobacillus foraminis]MBT2757256.1 IDEAL domain-containing protein [Mesobacillus foraminis]TCN26689.1 IDEAL domain-containing protein [Mesobacillus foraminis]
MNSEKPNFFNQDEYISSMSGVFHDMDETQEILAKKKTRYTKGANEIIEKVQQQFLENWRQEEIDKALDARDKNRFMALTGEGWEKQL